MKYELLDPENNIWARIDDDGLCRLTCSAEHPELIEWLASQTTPKTTKPKPSAETL